MPYKKQPPDLALGLHSQESFKELEFIKHRMKNPLLWNGKEHQG